MSNLFTQDHTRVLIIGIGSLGCVSARLGGVNDDGRGSVCWGAAHAGAAELIATGLERKIFLKIPTGPFAEKSASRSVIENAEAIAALARGRDAVVLCGCLSEPATPLIFEALSGLLNRLTVPVFVLALEPFSPLGLRGLEEVETSVKSLAMRVPFLALLNPGTDKISSGISSKRVQRMAAERLLGAAECFAAALDANPDRESPLQRLRGRHRAIYAAVNGSPANAEFGTAHAAFELALSCLDGTSREQLCAVMLQSAEDLPFRDAKAISRGIPDCVRHRTVVCASTRPAFAGQTACVLLSAERKAANVTNIAEAFQTVSAR